MIAFPEPFYKRLDRLRPVAPADAERGRLEIVEHRQRAEDLAALRHVRDALARALVHAQRIERAAAQPELAALVQAQAAAVELAPAEPAWADPEAEIARLRDALLELEYALIPHGLHVVGEPPGAEARATMLDAAGVAEPERRARLDALLAEDHELPRITCLCL